MADAVSQNTRQRFAVWTLITSLVGYLFWRVLRYLQRLWRQPRLTSRRVLHEVESREEIETLGATIAQENLAVGLERRPLLNGAEKMVLCAGMRNFREPWARDFGFASYGLLAMNQKQAVKEGLEVFLHYQRPSGQFPVKAHSNSVLTRYLHSLLRREQPITAPLKPKYVTAHNTVSLDGNALLVIAALHYLKIVQDEAFLDAHWGALTRAVTWLRLFAPGPHGLLRQSSYADWADSIARRGRVLYTNVLYWKAVHGLAEAAAAYDRTNDADQFSAQADQLRQAINAHFWRDDLGYYVTSSRFDNLNSDGNLLAVAWGLATPAQSVQILDNMDRFQMADPVPTQVVNRAYPRRYIGIENHLAGISEYHTHAAWLWLGAWHVVALLRLNQLAQAEELLYRMAQVIVRDGVVHEVYGQDGRFLSSRWYTSEAPLTWNAGMFVYAHHLLNEAKEAAAN